MTIMTGELVELYIENGTTKGKVKVNNAYIHVPMFFLLEAKVGDTLLIEGGVAISIYQVEEETEYVLSDTRQTHLN